MAEQSSTTSETIILGGGCFWCLEPVFDALRGVIEAIPGYSGGHLDKPSYEQVCRQETGHAEVVAVRFDPAIIDLNTLLQVFFSCHDPCSLNRQGEDVGSQYASVIFYQNPAQEAAARAVRAQMQALFEQPIVTRIEAAGVFWPAESYHRDYYRQNPGQGYCQMVITPKISKFRQKFAALLRHQD